MNKDSAKGRVMTDEERIDDLMAQFSNVGLAREVLRLRKALLQMQCDCIGPMPCVEDGSMCDRCAALIETAQ